MSFLDDDGTTLGSVAVTGPELLYFRHFQVAVLALTGELFSDDMVLRAADPQRRWLDVLAGLLPHVDTFTAHPQSVFDEHAGRVFRFLVTAGTRRCELDAPILAEYQEFQAVVAHQTGALFRDIDVESVDDAGARQARWWERLRKAVERPSSDDVMAAAWPWR